MDHGKIIDAIKRSQEITKELEKSREVKSINALIRRIEVLERKVEVLEASRYKVFGPFLDNFSTMMYDSMLNPLNPVV